MTIPIITIIGRPNVGKSTLFNRIIKKRKAVVSHVPGVTRDRNYHLTKWNRKSFYLVDTGGLVPQTEDLILKQVKAQAEIAISEADLILFMVDNQVGAQAVDLEIAKKLKKIQKKVILVVNKVDNPSQSNEIHVLNKLGLGEPFPVSAVSGDNVADLLDEIVSHLPEEEEIAEIEEGIQVAVLGRPNVGKSSFVNVLLGEEKLIVSEIPGTTRDSIDTQLEHEGQIFTLIDTAGLRRKAKILNELEYFTSLRSLRSIQRCDVALLLIEGPEGLLNQDIKIANEIIEAGKGLAILVNKWDLVEKESLTAEVYTETIYRKVPNLNFVPVLYVSAKTQKRVIKSLALITEIYQERKKRIETNQLNKILGREIEKQPPAAVKGKYVKIHYMTQTDVEPPEFVFFSNHPQLIQESYKRFLERKIQEHFGFTGSPLRLKFRRKS
ncbi:MAG: GTP-binding protein EngA [candidate division Zixibacteria bacterium RBG-1]|nr:MAG: GTP-binding protein EngA [candidate division Zixibacteria bacterium RBG-1]OGC84093.1 MAG: ribosome biogenesis GTPase Der [candidate division Zixibacteria bacterium RBG_19FT_COMBO_42_43]